MLLFVFGLIAMTVLLSVPLKKPLWRLQLPDLDAGGLHCRWQIVAAGVIYVMLALVRDVTKNSSYDIYAYYVHFQDASRSLPAFLKTSTFELGYTVFIWIIRQISQDFRLAMLLLYGGIYVMYAYFVRQIPWNRFGFLSVAALVATMFSGYYILRMYVSVGIALLAFVQVHRKHYVRTVLLALLAISFHNSALIIIPALGLVLLFQITHMSVRTFLKMFAGVLALACIGSFLIPIFMRNSPKYSFYVADNQGTVAWGIVAGTAVALLLGFWKYRELNALSSFNGTLLLLLCSNLLVIPLQLQFGIMYRMNMFFMPLQIVLLMQLQKVTLDIKTVWLRYMVCGFSAFYCVYRVLSMFLEEMIYFV